MAKWIPAQLSMFDLPTSPGSGSAISSPASAAGATPCASPDGLTTEPSGPEVVPASRSRPPARRLGATIRATFGRRGFASSASAALQSSLVNRLKQRLPTDGSILFAMTWKEKATPAGRSVCLLRASAHRTSASGCGSWPSPMAQQANGTPEAFLERKRRSVARGSQMGISLTDLQMVAQLASWPTATTHDAERGGQMKRAMGETRHGSNLQDFAMLASWATPTSRDHKDGTAESCQNVPVNALLGRQVTLSGSPAETGKPGQLNPAFSLWLMGYEIGFWHCAERVTRSSRTSPPK